MVVLCIILNFDVIFIITTLNINPIKDVSMTNDLFTSMIQAMILGVIIL